MNEQQRAFLVKSKALELGFASCGITDLSPTPHAVQLTDWLDRGLAGTMGYMHRQAAKRVEPKNIVPGATRAILLTRHYYDPDPPTAKPTHTHTHGKIAKYARGRDYHDALRGPLERLAEDVIRLSDDDTVARAFVDAGPVPERELAQRAGLGWIGKNTMLIDPSRGSFFFIAAILTNADLAVDPAFETDRCGTCRRCLDACPTDAFLDEWVLDSRRCISYLTIEYRGEIDESLRDRMDGWIFGCDVCQDVCPWNQKFARRAADPVLEHDPALAAVDLSEIIQLSDSDFDKRFGWTALNRPGAKGMRRNAEIAKSHNDRREPCSTP